MGFTKEDIPGIRTELYQLSSDGDHPRAVDFVCDRAAESYELEAKINDCMIREAALRASLDVIKFGTDARGIARDTLSRFPLPEA